MLHVPILPGSSLSESSVVLPITDFFYQCKSSIIPKLFEASFVDDVIRKRSLRIVGVLEDGMLNESCLCVDRVRMLSTPRHSDASELAFCLTADGVVSGSFASFLF
jgi:hypothetical protein